MGCVIEDEVMDTMKICGGNCTHKLHCCDKLSDEALEEFEKLVDESAPPETFWDRLRWTIDDWEDWLMGN